ncbi:hypothetical protein OH773_21935 (plasmid) [Buttiauxella sp. WJP83]|uniref:hypothetical protein n=1 Tax=Buttiauxella sp. WJP83 TaxID=2986951 RepID=UPI0022DE094D|nr:hypothetical protein [Buttiauxella sp. WJP83]WBM73025.1 hypothetical protein OH773_21935 [Buttiauxella sp. WJP83]
MRDDPVLAILLTILLALVLWPIISLAKGIFRRNRFIRFIGNDFPQSHLFVRGWGGIAVDIKNERFAVCKKNCLDWFDASQILELKVEHQKVTPLLLPSMSMDVTLRSERLPTLRVDEIETSSLRNIASLMIILADKVKSANEIAKTDTATQITDLINAVNRLTDAVTSLTDVARSSSTKSQDSADITK